MSIDDAINEIRAVHLYDAIAELNESTAECPFCHDEGFVTPPRNYNGAENPKFKVGCFTYKCPGNRDNSYEYDDATEAQSYWNNR